MKLKETQRTIHWSRIGLTAGIGFAIGFIALQGFVEALVLGGIAAIITWAIDAYQSGQPTPEPEAPPLSADMAEHYAKSGLSDADITLFRTTMDTVADQIRTFEGVAQRVPKINAIATNQDLLPVMHAFFKAIVEAPKQLGAAGHFVYEQLPNLVHIATQYEKINQHQVKTADTYAVLTTAANAITDLATAIRAGYTEFVESDLDILSADVALAHKQTAPLITESSATLTARAVDAAKQAEKEMGQYHE